MGLCDLFKGSNKGKRALCIGINSYPGNELQGCVNDARAWGAELSGRGFSVTYLLDKAATKKAIVEAMRKLVDETKGGEVGVTTFSGHGTWVADFDGDESDGRDEAICPIDCIGDQSKLVTDDELFSLFCERHQDSRIVFISDSCHSGTITREMKPLSPRPRFLSPAIFYGPEYAAALELASNRASTKRTSPIVALSGCASTEYSYDAYIVGQYRGAFSYHALRALQTMGAAESYDRWYEKIRLRLPSSAYPQTPQLDGPAYQRARPVLT